MSMDATLRDGLDRLTTTFEEMYDESPTVAVAAPGRVNLIGEHTDYNDGFVLPMAIEKRCVIVARPTNDGTAELRSTAQDQPAVIDLSGEIERAEPKWSNYPRGVLAGWREGGREVPGFRACVDSTVPFGGGLSSSAALEVAVATLLEALTGESLSKVDKALLCQKAEHEFAGVPCGIMDQFISAAGEAGAALLIDCRSHELTPVRMDDAGIAVLVIDSNRPHELSGGEYAQRRSQCEAAARALGVPALRDADVADLDRLVGEVDDLTLRRARHVITENRRTLDAAEALSAGRWAEAGRLMFASHASLRDDFEVSTPELDLLVELAEKHVGSGLYGARMTGGGFGGCTVQLVEAARANTVGQHIVETYESNTGIAPPWFITRAAAGARRLSW